jgi:capsular exopolysaccharide synthesis family protein
MLNRDMEASGELYKLVSKRLRTGGILAASNGPDITILDESPVPYQKVSSHTTANIASGIIIGLILGLILSVLLEGFDKRIATMRAVSELCPVPGVGVIPCIQKDGEDSLANQIDWKSLGVMDELETPGGEVADAFRTVRTTLNHSYAETQPSVILVTSPIHNEGSKSASINLAAAFARINQHVLLVDANLRENTSTRTGNSSAAGGLADALDGKDYHPFCIFPSNYQNLIYLPAGASLFNPPDLLDSARMRELITQWREEYDYVILSLPRLNDQSDAAILSTMVDTVLLTVRSGRGRRKDIQRAMKIISGVGAGLHGAIVTDLRSRSFFARATSWQSHPFTEQRKVYINESL